MPRGAPLLRDKRQSLGLSQLEVALQAQVSVRTLQFAEGGKKSISAQKLKQIAEALGVSEAEASACQDEGPAESYDRLPWSISRFIQNKAMPGPECFCRDKDEALAVIREMRNNWKHHLNSEVCESQQNSYQEAEQALNDALFRWESRYIRIWNRLPATFQLARFNGEYCGVCVVLPVTDEAFERMAEGKISFMDVTEDDIEDESQNIILDNAVEFFGLDQPPWHRVTDSIVYAVFSRIAALSIDPKRDDFRMLSFAASSINTNRLMSLGFQIRTEVMPEFGYQILQFSLKDCEHDAGLYPKASTTAHFVHLLRNFSLSHITSKAKRRVLTTGFRVLQSAVKEQSEIRS